MRIVRTSRERHDDGGLEAHHGDCLSLRRPGPAARGQALPLLRPVGPPQLLGLRVATLPPALPPALSVPGLPGVAGRVPGHLAPLVQADPAPGAGAAGARSTLPAGTEAAGGLPGTEL